MESLLILLMPFGFFVLVALQTYFTLDAIKRFPIFKHIVVVLFSFMVVSNAIDMIVRLIP